MKRFISKYSMPETLDLDTATSLVYIGLIILTAYLCYFYVPALSFVLILVLFFQRKCPVRSHLIKLGVMTLLLPLLSNLFFIFLKSLIMISFEGFSSSKSGIHIIFSNQTYNLLSHVLHFINIFLTCVAIAATSATLLLLNILFPIGKKFFRITIGLMSAVPLIIASFIGFFLGLANIINLLDFADYLRSGVDISRTLIIDKKIDDFYIRAYRTNYGGALGAFGVEVEQEKYLPFHLKLVRDISSYYHCDNVQMDVLNNHTIRITPSFDEHETNPDLKSPKLFYLKPFYTTSLINKNFGILLNEATKIS